jgi:hypothetical protein
MPTTINLARLREAEWDELLSAVNHHAEVLETDDWDEQKDERQATKSLLRILSQRPAVSLTITDLEHDILEGALEHHEEVYRDAVHSEDNPEPWLTIFGRTVSLRAKLGG